MVGKIERVPSLQMVTTVGATSDKTITLSNTSGGLLLQDNVDAIFGTGSDASIYYDGTDLIVDTDLVGSGILRIGPSGSENSFIANKCGLAGSAISANFIINVVTSGTARGAMQFDYTQTGTNILAVGLFKATSQHSNSANSSSCATLQVVKDTDSSGACSYTNASCSFGTINTRSITQGTHTFMGVDIQQGMGTGTSNTGGTVLAMGIRIQSFATYSGVSSYTKWGINSAEDIQIQTGGMLILEGSSTTKGDSGFLFSTATANKVEVRVDGTIPIDFRAATINVLDGVNFVLGSTTGHKWGTATTQKQSWYNATPVVQQTDGANLTNNVTSGGTTDTIANFTDLSVYANDAATIRNDIYQLARKTKIIGDALRTYGLLS